MSKPTNPKDGTPKMFEPQLLQAQRLIVATNRGPVEHYVTKNGTLKCRRGSGGVVTALIDAGRQVEMSWVAMAMTEGDRLALQGTMQQRLPSSLAGQKMHLHYVEISREAYRKYYERISNQLLWFLQHYLYNPTENSRVAQRFQDAWENGYCVANRAIAEAVIEEIEGTEGSAVVMLHDYHLYLVPRMIRQRHPAIVMHHFIHIPWPDIRCWHFLSSKIAHEIYEGLVGNDIIGFQTERDARNFLEGARTLLEGARVEFEEGTVEWQGHMTKARSYPISISGLTELKLVKSAAGKQAAEKLRPLLGKQTIMRVDRLEPTKNIVRGFQAYDLLLEQHPELHRVVRFLAFLVPSRQSLPEYQRYAREVKKIIEEVNQKYGTPGWQPITVFYQNDRTQALAAMQYYDVLMVNPIIDGMNLVAKEGPVVNQKDGVLLLSRTVGAFPQLGKASVPTSPIDIGETAEALYKALTLPEEERHSKATLARLSVTSQNLDQWIRRQIKDINELLVSRSPQVPAAALPPACQSVPPQEVASDWVTNVV